MGLYLETERVLLRDFTAADADLLVELDSDPEVMRYLTGGLPTPREEIEGDFLPHYLACAARGDRYGCWAAIERASGDFLGWFHLRPPADGPADEPELGYRLRRAVWGRGYGTEVSRALIDRAFAELGARRVFAQTYQDNVGSRRVMEKAGMTQVRTFRMSPEELVAHHPHLAGTLTVWEGDDVEYAIAREQWARQEAARREPLARPATGAAG